MAFKSDLSIWAETLVTDLTTNTDNRFDISVDLFDKGWLRENPVAAQHLNQILYLLSGAVKEETLTPSNNLSDIPTPSTARNNLGVQTTAEITIAVINSIYPVGAIYTITGNPANPNTILGVGTWVPYAEGRVIIGVGNTTDINAENQAFSDGASGGEFSHTLTTAEIPSHNHNITVNLNDGTGDKVADSDGGGTTNITSTSAVGSDDAHNNVQPYLVAFLWRRTA